MSQEACHRLVNRVCSCESLFACHTHGKLWGDVDDAGVAAFGLLDLLLAGGILALLCRCGM